MCVITIKSINEKKFIPVLPLTKHSTKRHCSYLFKKIYVFILFKFGKCIYDYYITYIAYEHLSSPPVWIYHQPKNFNWQDKPYKTRVLKEATFCNEQYIFSLTHSLEMPFTIHLEQSVPNDLTWRTLYSPYSMHGRVLHDSRGEGKPPVLS